MSIQGILFDIGDTLLPATVLQERALAAAADELHHEGLIPSAELFRKAYSEADQDPRLDAILDLSHLYSDARIVTTTLEVLRWPQSSAVVDRFLHVYRELVRPSIKPATEVVRLLVDLQRQLVKLGIASNGTSREQREQLMRLGISEFFNPILISQELGLAKPEPEFFLKAAILWRLDASFILVVGDRVDWEVLGAQRAGMQSGLLVQFIDRSHELSTEIRPNYIIRDLAELPGIVRSHNESRSVR